MADYACILVECHHPVEAEDQDTVVGPFPTKLDAKEWAAENPPEGRDSLSWKIVPNRRPEQARSSDTPPSRITLGPEDLRVLDALSIAQRDDGRWGYKLKCSNKACPNQVDACYCADGLLEAVRDAATRRSKHPCGTLCWMTGYGRTYLDEQPELHPEDWIQDAIEMTGTELWMKIHPGAVGDSVADSKDIWDALEALTEGWRYRHDTHGIQELRDQVEEDLGEAFTGINDGLQGYEPDMDECACPTGGGSA